ncbi:MAG: aspartyl-phosphate phosphatase Spo0E family protein [Clostridiales bacterium]|jgi:uncharacterized protein YpmS|nr:aspartyl-phosphate phosphatase Spo0E family protein [Clostridiales bacterium]
MDIIELYSKIEEKRKELNNLVSSRISDLSTSEIIKISNELDELIAAYFELFGLQINQEPVE